MIRHAISDADWARLAPLLPGRPGTPGRSGDNNRRFLHAVNWIARTGAPWRDLPPALGKWNSVWRRFDRWSKKGVWQRIAEHLQDPDFDWIAIDSTTVRAHQDGARPPARRGGQKRGATPEQAATREALGRSRGGLTTKVHATVDALGNPLRLLLTPGQRNDVTQAEALLEGYEPGAVLGDKGYDADDVLELIQNASAEPVIPPKSDRVEQREYDEELYRERNEVERFFGKLKLNRRIATRYEKTGRNYLSFVFWASVLVLLL